MTYMVLHVGVPPVKYSQCLSSDHQQCLGTWRNANHQTHQISYSENYTICILTFWRVILILGQPENRWQNYVSAVRRGRGYNQPLRHSQTSEPWFVYSPYLFPSYSLLLLPVLFIPSPEPWPPDLDSRPVFLPKFSTAYLESLFVPLLFPSPQASLRLMSPFSIKKKKTEPYKALWSLSTEATGKRFPVS